MGDQVVESLRAISDQARVTETLRISAEQRQADALASAQASIANQVDPKP